jgi:hypothetical protein
MERSPQTLPWAVLMLAMGATLLGAASSSAESCQTAGDLDAATRIAIVSAAQRYFDLAANGDAAGLRQNATAAVASDFSGIEAAVKNHRTEIAGSHGTERPPFLLDAAGSASIPHAEFFCGVFGKRTQSPDSAVFTLDDLSPGKYAIVILDAAAAKPPSTVSFILQQQVLQQQGSDWKLAGLYIRPAQAAGHAAEWFVSRARDYKAKNQLHNAWLYYMQARILISPLPFMSTSATDKLYDESQPLLPADFPSEGKTVDLVAGGTTYKLTAVFPQGVGNDLDLIVKYQASDVSETSETYQSNVTVIKALVGKFPEVRDAFAAVVARAVEPGGRDYGTLLAMKDIK